ncbi:hypothetical protein [Amycolatopsis sp. MtRt-6]|uniref:hypothetical protein n=1 Tax=Amycolatopsis sp. MtRt-6 TaxID=2792782 RepID=UPI001F5C0E18|nr:hypothetical protein [Amycolatopsis sp. MtRt-6]
MPPRAEPPPGSTPEPRLDPQARGSANPARPEADAPSPATTPEAAASPAAGSADTGRSAEGHGEPLTEPFTSQTGQKPGGPSEPETTPGERGGEAGSAGRSAEPPTEPFTSSRAGQESAELSRPAPGARGGEAGSAGRPAEPPTEPFPGSRAGQETAARTAATGSTEPSSPGRAAQASPKPPQPTTPRGSATGKQPATPRGSATGKQPATPSGSATGKQPATPSASATGKQPATPRSAATTEPPTWADDTANLTPALTLAGLGAVALAAAAFVPVSPAAGPGFTSWPWLALLALGPVAAAVWFAGKRPALGGGLLLGLAALAPGRLVLDLQFAVNGPLTIRPELYLPDRFLGSSSVGAGFWLLVAGHLLTGAAGVAAWRALRSHDEPERRRWRLLVPLLAVVAGAGLLTAPVHSDTGFLLARAAFEGPWPALGGYLLLAAALPLAAALALAAPAEHVARGALGGLAAAAFGVAAPPVLAGLFRDDLHVTWGPVLTLLATAGIAGLAATRLTEATESTEKTDLAGTAKLPSLFWWRLTTGLLGLATTLAALIGAFAPQVAVTALNPGAVTPVSAAADSPARWFLLVAAVVLAVPAAGVLVPRTAAVARPVLGVAWAGIVLAGTAVLNTALTATQAGNLAGFGGTAAPVFTYDLGAGAAGTFVALVLAVLAALAAAGTGVVEREDAGEDAGRGNVLAPAVAGAILAVAAFGLPVFAVPGYAAAGLWSRFDTPSWGLLTAAAVVVGAAALATRSRPKPAAALLAGAALLTALHAAELPLVGGSLGGASPATGFWVALAATAALLVAAGLAVAGGRRAP